MFGRNMFYYPQTFSCIVRGGALQYAFFFPSSAAALALRYNKVASLTSELEQSKSDLSAAQQQVWQDQQHQGGDTLYRNCMFAMRLKEHISSTTNDN